MSIDVCEIIDPHRITLQGQGSFDVLFEGSDYDNLESLAYELDISLPEAVKRIIKEGMP